MCVCVYVCVCVCVCVCTDAHNIKTNLNHKMFKLYFTTWLDAVFFKCFPKVAKL